MDYQIFQINENTWRFEEEGVRFFLLIGEKKALLLDSGMKIGRAKEAAQTLTSLPIEIMNTHADPDHIGSNFEFEQIYMNPNEEQNYQEHGGKGKIIPVKEGDIVDLGNRPLEIIELPGHTPGSIGILDVNARALFAGDSVQKNSHIFMFGKRRNLNQYIETLERLSSMTERFETIYSCHGDLSLSVDSIADLLAGAKKIASGEITGKKIKLFNSVEVNACDIGCGSILI